MTAAALVLLVNVVTSVLKKYVIPKYGEVGVQVLAFVVAIAIAIFMNYGADYMVYVKEAGVVFAFATTLYVVILKRIGFFKKGL